jgi:gliding motility-associated-like protein
MKRIIFVFFMSLLSLCGYSQLAEEGFENPWAGTPPAPTGWNSYNNGVGPAVNWAQATGSVVQPAFEGSHAAYLNKENVASGLPADYLVTPTFNVPVGGQLRFYSRLSIAGDQLGVYTIRILPATATDPTVLADYVTIQTWNELTLNPVQTDYTEKVVLIPAEYEGTDVRIAFVMEGDDADRWLIDNVKVVEQCLDPTGLTAENPGLDTADLSWTNSGSATQFEIEIVGEDVPPTGSGDVITGTTYGATAADGLVTDSGYKFYIRAICADGGESNWVGPVFFQTVGLGDSCSAPLTITTLPFSDSDDTANFADQYNGLPGTGCGNQPWEDYLSGNDVVYEFTAGFTGTVSVDLTNNAVNSGVFVYNDCTDIGVSCFAGGIAGWDADPISYQFAVTSGQNYYVVVSSYTSITTPYTLILQQVFCDKPVGLPTTNLGMTTASLSWTNPSGATSWQVEVQPLGTDIPAGAGEYTATTNTNWAVPTADLTASTAYQYYVRAACGDGNFSAWAGPYPFNTSICAVENQCTYTFDMWDQWNGLWDGNTMSVIQNGITIATLEGPSDYGMGHVYQTVQVCNGFPLELFWNAGGDWPNEVGVAITNGFDQPIFTHDTGSGAQNTSIYSEASVDCDTPLCLPPTGLTATNPTLDSIDLGWAGPATGNWEYYIVEAGQPAPTDATVGTATTSNPAVGAGPLDAATEYEFYVRMICEDASTDFSAWAGPFAFSSSVCDPANKCDYTFIMKSDWWAGWQGGYMTISQNGTTVAVIGSTFITGQTQEITIPLCHGEPIEVYWDNGGSYDGQIGLDIVNTFDQTFFSLPFYTGGVGTMIYEGDADCLVPLCLPPTGLTSSDATTTTVDLAWDGPAVGAWEYYVVEAGSPAPSDATSGTATTTNPTLNVPLPNPSTNYEYYLRLDCEGASTDFSTWAGPYAFHSEVCEPGDKCTFFFEMSSVNGWGYENNIMTIFQGGVPVAEIGSTFTWGADDMYTQTVEVPLCPNVPIEIFWNAEGWDDFDKGLIVYTPFLEEMYIMDPGTESQGTTIYTGTASCDPPTCPKPQNLAVGVVGMDYANLSWNEMGTATQWEVFVQPVGGPDPQEDTVGVIANSNPFLLTEGIEPGVDYEYYVRAICSDTDESRWSRAFPFQASICDPADKCPYTFTMSSTYMWDDGWQGDTMDIVQNGIVVATLTGPTLDDDNADVSQTVELCTGIPFKLHWNNEYTWNAEYVGISIVHDYTSETIFEFAPGSGTSSPDTDIYTGIPYCAPITCPQPTDLSAAGFDLTSVILDWEAGGTETQWEVVIQPMGGSYPADDATPTATVNETTFHAEDLVEGQFYEYYVRAVCGEGDASFWSGPMPFNIFNPPGCNIEVVDLGDLGGVAVINGAEFVLCPDDDNCVNLQASYLETGDTSTYEVESIDYAPPYPFTGGTPVSVGTDDIWSPVAQLPFDFCFFGENYSSAIIGSNGAISFDTTNASGYCPWSFSGEIPNPSFPILNAIYGVYQDIYPPTNNDFAIGDVNYQVLGNYPCRALVVNFNKVGQFSCFDDAVVGAQTTQVVLYEITNVIEVYVDRRVPCNQWQNGAGVLGIQNADGTVAVVPEGRNTGNWEAHEEAWRFVPAGPSNTTFEWLRDNVVVSNDVLADVCVEPGEAAIMTARATYTDCNGDEIIKESVVTIRIAEPIVADPAKDLTICLDSGDTTFDLNEAVDGIIAVNPENYEYTYYTSEVAASEGGDDNISSDYEYTGSENVELWVRINRIDEPCFIVDSFQLIINSVEPVVQPADVTICDKYELPALTNGNYFTGSGGTGVQLSVGEFIDSTQLIYVYAESGTTPNCTSEESFTVTIIPTPAFSLGGPYVACDATDITVTVTPSNFNAGSATFAWTLNGADTGNTGSSAAATGFGTYAVTVTVGDCTHTESVEVTENTIEVAALATDFCEDNVYMLEVTDVDGSFEPASSTYVWTNAAGAVVATTQEFAVPAKSMYTVTVTTADNCTGTASFDVIDTNCDIQRGISPNEDGLNDNFDLTTLDVDHIGIFNRYGQEVYSHGAYTNQWHGQGSNGDELPTGTYFYMIERSNGEQITGWIYINREE